MIRFLALAAAICFAAPACFTSGDGGHEPDAAVACPERNEAGTLADPRDYDWCGVCERESGEIIEIECTRA